MDYAEPVSHWSDSTARTTSQERLRNAVGKWHSGSCDNRKSTNPTSQDSAGAGAFVENKSGVTKSVSDNTILTEAEKLPYKENKVISTSISEDLSKYV